MKNRIVYFFAVIAAFLLFTGCSGEKQEIKQVVTNFCEDFFVRADFAAAQKYCREDALHDMEVSALLFEENPEILEEITTQMRSKDIKVKIRRIDAQDNFARAMVQVRSDIDPTINTQQILELGKIDELWYITGFEQAD